MNICVLNSCWQGGGAEAISRAIYEGLQQYADCNMFFVSGSGPLEEQNRIFANARAKDITDWRYKIRIAFRKNVFLKLHRGELRHEGYATRWLIRFIKENNIDILHINNIHGAFIGIRDIKELSKYCKIVWTLHDLWSMTGHCVHPFECEKWIEGDCNSCPRPWLMCKVKGNVARRSLEDKRKYFTGANITYIAISQWMKNNIEKGILKNEKVQLIHNGIDTSIFREKNRKQIRTSYGFSDEEKVLLFVANGVNSLYKGMDVLINALQRLSFDKRNNITLMICGDVEDKSVFESLDGYRIMYTGYIGDNAMMADVYNAADVFVAPSRAETFSLVVVESMACGTPVIGSSAGGIPELISQDTGWIFESGNSVQLADTIQNVLCEPSHDSLEQMRECCRKRAQAYDIQVFLEKYRKLYLSVLEGVNE